MRPKVYKVILVGEGGVGKTSLALRYTDDRFEQDMRMTIGVNFASKKVCTDMGDITLLLWDLGGQPRFQEVVSDYFRGASMGVAVFDVTRKFTLYRLDDWIDRLRKAAPQCRLVLVGNKIDERDEGEGVSPEMGRSRAQELSAPYFEVSAKTGEHVDEMFNYVARRLCQTQM